MYTFQFKHGDRPLEGYTIERAAGRGGFGEVYFAISDSGRQVALKAVQGYEQIELRGISQCMNLKNPHLVTIFDVRHNDAGRPFVIMEYVAGPSLRQILDESPAGLGEQKSAFFLREIAKGLSYLHENGIVHRDLKPANIFFENGYVKIGDYGLSKLIDAGAHSGQTVTVGTVHYMAPEVGAGRYDRSIDIYALGAVLFEMLTGTVPFTGGSPSEVLIKHLSREPDVSHISEPFATVIRRAMAKDPAQRYASVQEMVEAIFGNEHVRQSVSCFSPDDLSMVAAHAAARMGAAGAGSGPKAPVGAAATATATAGSGDFFDRAGQWADRMGNHVYNAGERWFDPGKNAAVSSHTMNVAPMIDPLDQRQRRGMALMTGLGIALLAAVLHHSHTAFPLDFLFAATAISGATIGLRIATRRLSPQATRMPGLVPRMAIGGPAIIMAALCSFPFCIPLSAMSKGDFPAIWIGIAAPLLFMDTARWVDPFRKERVCFWGKAFLAGLFAFIVASMFDGPSEMAAVIAGGICIVAQLVSPWNPRPKSEKDSMDSSAAPPPLQPTKPWQQWQQQFQDQWRGQWQQQVQQWTGAATGGAAAIPVPPPAPPPPPLPVLPLVPGFIRLAWLLIAMLAFSIGLTLLISLAVEWNPEVPAHVCGGLGLILGAVVCFVQFFRKRFAGWWSYLGKPLMLLQSIFWISACSAVLANASMRGGMGDQQQTACIFVIIIASIAGIVSLCISGRRRPATPGDSTSDFARQIADRAAAAWQSQSQRQQQWDGRSITQSALAAFAGVAATWLLVAATLLTLGVAANVPEGISLGLPNPVWVAKLATGPFADYPAWPELMLRLGSVVATICAALGLGALALNRGSGGAWFIIRGIIATLGVFAAAMILGHAFHQFAWTQIAQAVAEHRSKAAVTATVLDAFDSHRAIAAGVIWLISMMLFAWHPKRHPMMAPPMSVAPPAIPTAPSPPTPPVPPSPATINNA